jgi:hypothetical protein
VGEITHIFSTLVSPGKHEVEPEEIHGTAIPLDGDLFAMLATIYDKAEEECNLPIRFVSDGAQHNDVRSEFIALIEKPTLQRASKLAELLGSVTTARSGLGLLFFVIGQEGNRHKLLVSRFPANHGILAETQGAGLTVEFVERVFMKNTATYKAALYASTTPRAEFWEGDVVDKQTNPTGDSAANYWIREFLLSELRTTSKAGSKRLATAMREAAKGAASVDEKHQIVSAMSLMAGLKGQTISPLDIFERFGLSRAVRDAITAHLPNDESLQAAFVLDAEEFKAVAAFRSARLDNGGVLTAATEDFDRVFERQVLDERTNRVRFSTVGTVVDEKVKGTS